MKGIIFNEFEAMVIEIKGADAWEDLIDCSKLSVEDGAFVGPKAYPDSDLHALVGAASELFDIPPDKLVTSFGAFLFPRLAKRFPYFVKEGMSCVDFLSTVDRIIHVEVKKLHPDAVLPKFDYETPEDIDLVMIYDSPRKLCDLVTGMLNGVATHFNEELEQTQTTCTKRGDADCRFELKFSPKAS